MYASFSGAVMFKLNFSLSVAIAEWVRAACSLLRGHACQVLERTSNLTENNSKSEGYLTTVGNFSSVS